MVYKFIIFFLYSFRCSWMAKS